MATEIVEQGPSAFTGFDSSVYLAWMKGLSELMMSGGDPNQLTRHTLANVGGLMYALTEAADELSAMERKDSRETP